MTDRYAAFMLKFFSVVLTLLLLLWATLTYGQRLESQYIPVMQNWTPQSVEVDGLDITITGMVLKNRGCKYAPPPRARDRGGKHYTVVSTNTSAATTWAPRGTPQVFGPWRVIGGRGVELELYQEHNCHPLWPTFSILGRVSTPPLKGTP